MIKDNLKKIREEHGLTKRELCEKTGISERAYLTYEFGEREPKIGVIQKLADFYDVTTMEHLQTKDILKKLREEKGLTIKEVAIGTGMQYTMCREYESGDRKLGMSAAIKYADFYNCSIDYLLGRSKNMMTPDEKRQKIVEEYSKLDAAGQQILYDTVAALVKSLKESKKT
mgnify:CR=1 FL=1